MKRFLLYLLRWQMSTPIIALVTYLMVDEFGAIITSIIANLIGGIIFYKIDKFIFSNKKKIKKKDNADLFNEQEKILYDNVSDIVEKFGLDSEEYSMFFQLYKAYTLMDSDEWKEKRKKLYDFFIFEYSKKCSEFELRKREEKNKQILDILKKYNYNCLNNNIYPIKTKKA